MRWRNYETWFKGALIGTVITLVISIGLIYKIPLLTQIAFIGFFSCYLLTHCYNCVPCMIVGLVLNLIYGYVIGAIIGWIMGKCCRKKNKIKQKVNRKKK